MAPSTFNVEEGNKKSVTVKVVKSPSCIKVKANGAKFLARVSTGNGHSMCSKKVLEELKLELDEEKEESIELTLGTVEAIGRKTITIMIGNAVVRHQFFVVKNLAEDFWICGDVIFGKFGGLSLTNRIWGQRITLGPA